MEVLDGELILGLNQAPSMNAVLRALKREEASMCCCVASIAHDAQFVQQVAGCFPSLPLFANLRCGLWYVAPPVQHTCYFKSTDGHNNNWSFSTVRLNLHVAAAAAAAGGCLIVDATKRGKRFPDAMSKTIPIWAATLNRAVARLRSQGMGTAVSSEAGTASQGASTADHAAAAVAAAAAGVSGMPPAVQAPWDCDVHLPPWVSAVEANSIRQRLEGWTDQLLEVGADLSVLVATLHKPLRCIWISQDTGAWQCTQEQLASLSFTPMVLIGASATTARHTRCLQLPPEHPEGEPLCISYRYFPGAADDEESWSRGLSPPLMWRHLHALLAAGPSAIEGVAAQLVEQARQQQGQQQQQQQQDGQDGQQQQQQHVGAAAEEGERATTAGRAAPGRNLQTDGQQHIQHGSAGPGRGAAVHEQAPGHSAITPQSTAAGPACNPGAVSSSTPPAPLQSLLQQPAEGGLHCLLPQGCCPAQAAVVRQVGAGIFLLADTRLAISSSAAAAAPGVWQHVDAVLHLGTQPVPGMEQEQQPEQQQQLEGEENGQQQVPAAPAGQPNSRASQATGSARSPATCRYCWLPVRCAKQDRHALQQQLPAALRFAASQLGQGRRLLVSCDSGLDASVCGALACLLAFYRLDLQPGGGTGLAYVGLTAAAATAAAAQECPAGDSSAARQASLSSGSGAAPPAEFMPLVGQAGLSKLTVRQHLAALSAHYPSARPTRGSIKQVYNFFLSQLGGSATQQ